MGTERSPILEHALPDKLRNFITAWLFLRNCGSISSNPISWVILEKDDGLSFRVSSTDMGKQKSCASYMVESIGTRSIVQTRPDVVWHLHRDLRMYANSREHEDRTMQYKKCYDIHSTTSSRSSHPSETQPLHHRKV